jgi:hypothetical protein
MGAIRWVLDMAFSRGRVRLVAVVLVALVGVSAPVLEGAASAASTPCGYWLVGSDGGVFAFGQAQFQGSTGSLTLQRPVVGIETENPGNQYSGYWLVASDGGVFAFDTGFFGSIPGLGINPAGSGLAHSLNAPIVGLVRSADGGGYFMVASDGGVFAFGDAHFSGSCPGIGGCAGSAVSVMPDATGNGYWLVTSTGNVYGFGDASYFGGPGLQSTPITSAAATEGPGAGAGYYVLAASGEVFNYGDAPYFGSLPAGATNSSDPATAIIVTDDGGGYWIATALGQVYPFGDAPAEGNLSSTTLNGSIIAGVGF